AVDGARQRLVDVEPAGHLEGAQRLPAPPDQVGGVDPVAGADVRLDRVAEDHDRLGDAFVAEQYGLDFGQVDLEAADGDHAVGPAVDADHTGGRVDGRQVEGAQPAVDDPAGLVGDQVRRPADVHVEFAVADLGAQAVRRGAHRGRPVPPVQVGGDDPHLGHAVRRAQRHAELGAERVGGGGSERLASGYRHPQARQVAGGAADQI